MFLPHLALLCQQSWRALTSPLSRSSSSLWQQQTHIASHLQAIKQTISLHKAYHHHHNIIHRENVLLPLDHKGHFRPWRSA